MREQRWRWTLGGWALAVLLIGLFCAGTRSAASPGRVTATAGSSPAGPAPHVGRDATPVSATVPVTSDALSTDDPPAPTTETTRRPRPDDEPPITLPPVSLPPTTLPVTLPPVTVAPAIVGVVLDDSGRPVPGLCVTAHGATQSAATETDDAGTFTFLVAPEAGTPFGVMVVADDCHVSPSTPAWSEATTIVTTTPAVVVFRVHRTASAIITIVDSSGRPIEGVCVEGQGSHSGLNPGITGSDGRARLDYGDTDTYEIFLFADGCQGTPINNAGPPWSLELHSGEIAHMTITIP